MQYVRVLPASLRYIATVVHCDKLSRYMRRLLYLALCLVLVQGSGRLHSLDEQNLKRHWVHAQEENSPDGVEPTIIYPHKAISPM